MTLHVTFRVGTADYAIPADHVLHLDPFEGATHVPGAPAFVAGLVHVRGRVVPVVDLRSRFGLPPGPADLQQRIIVVQVGTRIAGLLVDRAREVMQIDPATYQPPPDLVEAQASGFVTAIAAAAGRLYLVIDVPTVIGEELAHA